MPDIPAPALDAAERAIIEAATDFGHDDIVAGPSGDLARAALEAAVPILAEAVAQKILAHRDNHGPEQHTRGYLSWRRYFTIAAQVASLAFSTEQDLKRMAAEALAPGNYVACPAPEDGTDGH